MLCCYADELKEGFFPWIDEVIHVLVPLLKFYFHEEVRRAAVAAMPGLLRSAELAVEKGQVQGFNVKQLFDHIISALVEALSKELETEICSSIIDSLNECLQLSCRHLVEHQAGAISNEIKNVTIATRTWIRENSERSKAEDFVADEQELLKEENEHEEVFDRVAKCLGILIRKFKASFLQFFDELSVHITPMLGKDRTVEERRIAICIFNDVADHCRESALEYYGTFLPSILESTNDDNSDIRKAAVYGVGVCAKFGGLIFRHLVDEVLIKLRTLLKRLELQYPHNSMVYDNAVSALETIIQFHWDSCYASGVKKQFRAEWSQYDSRVFCNLCVEEIEANRMLPGIWPEEYVIDNIREKLFSRTARVYNNKQLKTKWNNLKRLYNSCKGQREDGRSWAHKTQPQLTELDDVLAKDSKLHIRMFDICLGEEKEELAAAPQKLKIADEKYEKQEETKEYLKEELAIATGKLKVADETIEHLKDELGVTKEKLKVAHVKFKEQEETIEYLKNELAIAAEMLKVADATCGKQGEQLAESERIRKEQHNIIMELKGKIRVYVRVRPLKDDGTDKDDHIVYPESIELLGRGIGVKNKDQEIHFKYDKVFNSEATQHDVFREVSELVQSAMDGYKVCIFSYGQTGSGKTYSMIGKPGRDGEGIIPRSLHKIFESSQSLDGWSYFIIASALEVYNDDMYDLLAPGGSKISNLCDLFEAKVLGTTDAIMLLEKALQGRSVRCTKMNEVSSRSHFMLRLRICGSNVNMSQQVEGVLNLIDLAGSERTNKSGSTGPSLNEANAINRSLSAMTGVFNAIANGYDHIPFRNSTFTHLLEPYLGEGSKTLMLVNIAPEASSSGETLCSLRFASRVNVCSIGAPRRQQVGTENRHSSASSPRLHSVGNVKPKAVGSVLKSPPGLPKCNQVTGSVRRQHIRSRQPLVVRDQEKVHEVH